MGACRDADSASAYDFFGGQLFSIKLFVGAAIGAQGRAFQRNSGEQAFVARVGEDLGAHNNIGCAFSGAALGTGGGRGVRSQLHFAVKKTSGAFGIHHQEHKVGGLAAQLKSDADAFERIQGRGSPFAFVVFTAAADHHAPSVAAADPKCSFFHGGQDDQAFGLVQQILRKVVGDIQNFFQNHAGS